MSDKAFDSDLGEKAQAYAHGQCHELASVISSLTGWPIHAGLVEDMWTQKTCLVHAWVSMPDGRALDAHGVSDPKDLLLQYPDGDQADVCVLSQDDVLRLGGGRKTMSQKARKAAEVFANDLLADLDVIQVSDATLRPAMRG